MTERRDRIIQALVGVDLTCAQFTWSAPSAFDRHYCVWVSLSSKWSAGAVVWRCVTHAEALQVREEMEVLSQLARKLAQ